MGKRLLEIHGHPLYKYTGIIVEREAYKQLLGPTLADQLQHPLFLATLEPIARPFYWWPSFSRSMTQFILAMVRAGAARAGGPGGVVVSCSQTIAELRTVLLVHLDLYE